MSEGRKQGEGVSGPDNRVREARLKPEFASVYPYIRPGVWYLAASVVSAIWLDGARGAGERLSDEHFEFRGPAEERPAGARTRLSDKAADESE